MDKIKISTLGRQFQRIIEKSIESGRYSSAKEVIRAGLRMVDRERKIHLLLEAADAGKRSGYVKDFDPAKYLAELQQKHSE